MAGGAGAQVLKGEAYDGGAVDVWSCGCSLYILLCGDYPFRTAAHHRTATPIQRMQAMFPKLCAGDYNPLRPDVRPAPRLPFPLPCPLDPGAVATNPTPSGQAGLATRPRRYSRSSVMVAGCSPGTCCSHHSCCA